MSPPWEFYQVWVLKDVSILVSFIPFGNYAFLDPKLLFFLMTELIDFLAFVTELEKGKLCPPLVWCFLFSLWNIFLHSTFVTTLQNNNCTLLWFYVSLLWLTIFLWFFSTFPFPSDCFCHIISISLPWQVGLPIAPS